MKISFYTRGSDFKQSYFWRLYPIHRHHFRDSQMVFRLKNVFIEIFLWGLYLYATFDKPILVQGMALHRKDDKPLPNQWWSRSLMHIVASVPYTHYNDVIMGVIASQITSLTIVYSTVYSDADQRKHQSSASLAFVRRIRQGPAPGPVNSPYK